MFKYLTHFILFGSILATTYACKEPKRGTVFLTFDDSAVDDWYALADSLRDIDYKATYYVTNYHEFDLTKKVRLKSLYERGHEVGHHSYDHPSLEAYADKPFDHYLEEQIFPLQQLFEADGYQVTSFAYPYGIVLPYSDSLLLHHFKSVRHLAYAQKIPLYEHNVSLIPAKTPVSAVLYAVGIDQHYRTPWEDIYRAIDSCVLNQKSLLLLAHYVGNDPNHEWMTDQQALIQVLRYAHQKGMRFGTINELEVYNPFELSSKK